MDTTDPRTGTRFAVYLCPPAESEYYRLGSETLGYDVRARQQRPLPADIRPEWQTAGGPYGFHLTLLEGFYCAPEALPEIEAELRACVACLSPTADLSLHAGRVELWDGGTVLTQMFRPSPHLLLLHALLLGRMARFVTHSPFLDRLAANPGRYPEPYQRARLALLYTPRGLDTFEPHYTLVDPFGGSEGDGKALRQRLDTLMAPWAEQTYASVALFVKPEGELRWQVWTEVAVQPVEAVAGLS
ncbi:hypothetical protein [Deinococcus sp.]|uniref:hypothetical protein n=1 Tax=Deinococcus sp. TaxID=47478 RepID=UPI003C7ECD1B